MEIISVSRWELIFRRHVGGKCYVRKDDGGLQPCSSFEVDLELALEGNPLGHQYYFVAHYRPQPAVTVEFWACHWEE